MSFLFFSLIPDDAIVQGSYVVPKQGGTVKVYASKSLGPVNNCQLSAHMEFFRRCVLTNISSTLGGTELNPRVTCYSIYLDILHSSFSVESSCQPSVASRSICCLSSQRALSLCIVHPKKRGVRKRKILFFKLMQIFLPSSFLAQILRLCTCTQSTFPRAYTFGT